jgi:hypothetical protein
MKGRRDSSLGVVCKDGGQVHVAGEHVGNITVDGKPTTIFDDVGPRSDLESLAREMVAKFGLAKARTIALLAREARITGDDKGSIDKLVALCREAGIEIDGDTLSDAPKRQQSFGFDTTHGFLGEEFCLWLWFRWERDGGEFTLPGGRTVGIAIDDLLVFAPRHDDETQQTLRRGLPTRTAEARTALRQGNRISRARLIIAEGQLQWTLTLDGERLAFSGVKLPEDGEDCESDTDRTAERAANWLVLHEIVAGLFAQFLRVRLAPAWLEQEAPAMAAWMRS